MQQFTRYLNVRPQKGGHFRVSVADTSPVALLQEALSDGFGLRYSPILPAYPMPGEPPPACPGALVYVGFLFSQAPHNALGRIKPELDADELGRIYFTQGLASIVCLNFELARVRELREHMSCNLMEFWLLDDNSVDPRQIIIEPAPNNGGLPDSMTLQLEAKGELAVYVEQILACVVTLRQSYCIYNPGELKTLDRITRLTERLIERHDQASANNSENIDKAVSNCKICNAITSALAEIGASLSYAVTQGCTGCAPILANPSPFPHFSLLGIGGSVRALTKFTRYLEAAFAVRDASGVIEKEYSERDSGVPARISVYGSGDEYRLAQPNEPQREQFDLGGEFPQKNNVPLIAYFSARHGFKESKFAITAASESLTSEVTPQWTMMTLSHEIMHNRVREIFQALFGWSWGSDTEYVLGERHSTDFIEWYESKGKERAFKTDCGIRNAVLSFCCAMERELDVRRVRRTIDESKIGLPELSEIYHLHRFRAVELFVHFHDFYYTYACQRKMYTMSLWASWIKVAAPFTRPADYLVRTLATIACGTGQNPRAAFDRARDTLDDALGALSRIGIGSPLFDKLRKLVTEETVYACFKPSYYLMDQVRRYFASKAIAERIDRVEDDPFAEGSTSAVKYSATVFSYGEGGFVSPIRYSLASFLHSLSGRSPIEDRQWLTAWNSLVISSQEVNPC